MLDDLKEAPVATGFIEGVQYRVFPAVHIDNWDVFHVFVLNEVGDGVKPRIAALENMP